MGRDKEEMSSIAKTENGKEDIIIEKIEKKKIPLIEKMRRNALRVTEALGLPREDMPIVMAALYRDQLPQHLLDEINELAETEQEEPGELEIFDKQEDTAANVQESKQEDT